jgi:hypothetical protein
MQLEQELLKKIAKLEQEIAKLSKQSQQKEEIQYFKFSQISEIDLNNIVKIKQKFIENRFDYWFNSDISISENDKNFLIQLLQSEKKFLKIYNEEELSVKFISPILNRINFKIPQKRIRDFFEHSLTYKTEKFIFNGSPDFLVANGEERPEKPYFFIQEFKKAKDPKFPEPQLLAEMIAGLEISNFSKIKGAYIIGINWYFVILEKIEKDSYQYFVSEQFNSTKKDELFQIYKNLLFVKRELEND